MSPARRGLAPSRFDADQAAELAALVRANALVAVPLFANTLPFGFHFALALALAKQAAVPANYPRVIPWGDFAALDSLVKDAAISARAAVWYSSRAYAKRFAASHPPAESDDTWTLTFIPVTRYQPKWLFVKGSVRARIELGVPRPDDANDAIRFLADGSERCELFSDIPDQADELRNIIHPAAQIPVEVVRQGNQRRLDPAARPYRVLELFFFSAPGANVLRHDSRYFAIDLSRIGLPESAADAFATGIVIASPPRMPTPELDALHRAVTQYHTRMYAHADDPDAHRQESFAEATWLFNRLTRERHVTDTFGDEKQYARCLADHHAAPTLPGSETLTIMPRIE